MGFFAWGFDLETRSENCVRYAARQSAGRRTPTGSDTCRGWRVSGITPLFTEDQIRARVQAIAREIASAPLKPDIALPVLAGSFVFAADLLRALAKEGLSLSMEFVWLRRYGAERYGSEVAGLVGPPEELHGRTALLIDGVLDHGHTLMKARDLLLENGAATVIT